MIVHPFPQRPWENASVPADANQRLPDFNDLTDAPQLASVAVLQVAAKVAAESLLAQHGVARRLVDELDPSADCIVPILARLIVERCTELSELIAAYRLAAVRPDRNDLADDPF